MNEEPLHGPEGATVEDPGARVLARLRRAHVRVLAGGEKGLRRVVPEEGILIGSQAPADLVLGDAKVSRRHAEIRRAPSGFQLRDLDSKNGTYIADHRIGFAYLGHGSVFRVGDTEVVFEAHEEDVRVEPAAAGDALGFVAQSPAMRAIVSVVRQFGATDLSIVLEGETGAGKEVVARALHRVSRRADRPLVVVDCSALQENLVESELFGHERGAYTGAVDSRAGAFETADGGTIFLDEVGELPLALQPKLLRVLEAREVRRLGSNRVRSVDVRVLAATNRDLPTEIAEKRFRPDLFFRLSEVRMCVPPLRERPEDLVPLAEAIAREVDPGTSFRSEAFAVLRARSWPGNVRELANVVRRAVVAAQGGAIGPEHLAPADLGAVAKALHTRSIDVDTDLPIVEAREAAIAAFNRVYLETLMERHAGDYRAAAKHAGVHVNSLHRLLRVAGFRERDEEE